MAQLVMLDAAFPPASPVDWVTDIVSVGGRAGAIYTFGGFLNYTPQHVQQARQSGVLVLPIVVPGNNPPDPRIVLGSVGRYGIASGPVAVDRETGSLYPASWDDEFDRLARASGYWPIEYHNLNDARQPADVDDEWIARWLRTGAMNPVPSLPSGMVAWQFVDDVKINNSVYDVSVVQASLWQPYTPILQSGGSMSNNIIIPDDSIAPALWRVVLEDGSGHVWFGIHAGGEGEENTNAWVNDLSAVVPEGSAPVALEPDTLAAALHTWQGVKRLVISGRLRGGMQTMQATVKAEGDYAMIEQWHPIALNVTIAKAQQGPKGDSGADVALRNFLRGVPTA